MLTFLTRFEREYPFRRGQRNDVALTLGRKARGKGFSTPELENLITLYSGRNVLPDFNEQDICQRVMAGYQYIKKLPASQSSTVRLHLGSTFPYEASDEKRMQPDKADLSEKDDELRAATPCIPDEVYDSLHPVLHHCVEMAANPRELVRELISCFYEDVS